MITPKLLQQYPIISDQVDARELSIILTQLETVLMRGDANNIVEFGCYAGTTSLFIARLCRQYNYTGEFHVYDSFAGLPDKSIRDASPAGEQFQAGELSVSKREFITNFKKAGLPLPYIHKNWFNELVPNDVPDAISFAFLDGDYYESIRDSFRLITPKLARDALIIVDDYANLALPGAARATDEWLAAHPTRHRVEHSLAVIKM